MANEKTAKGGRAKGKRIAGAAAKWLDGEDVLGVLVSAIETVTKHGPRALVTVERADTGEHESRFMPAHWADKLGPLTGQRIAMARDGKGMECQYDVRLL